MLSLGFHYRNIYYSYRMDWSLDGLQALIKYSTYAFAGWLGSWIIFFLLVPFMTAAFGKVRGTAINYGLTWVVMVAIVLGLEFGLKKDESYEELVSMNF